MKIKSGTNVSNLTVEHKRMLKEKKNKEGKKHQTNQHIVGKNGQCTDMRLSPEVLSCDSTALIVPTNTKESV